MKPQFFVLTLCLLAAAVFSLASQSNARRTPRGQVHALQATSDSDGSGPEISVFAGCSPPLLRRRSPTGLSRLAMLLGQASQEF